MDSLPGFGIDPERFIVKALANLETPERLGFVDCFVNVSGHCFTSNIHLNMVIDSSFRGAVVFPRQP